MLKLSKQIPIGMRDYLFKDASIRRMLENKITSVFAKRNYCEVITPTLEFLDVFFDSDGVSQEDLYKLFDTNGRILSLRHDMTTPIARVAGTKLESSFFPFKFFYHGSVFRQNEHLSGKYDEVMQCGVELIGMHGKKADIEVIITAIETMKELDVGNFKIELGHIGFFKAIASLYTKDEALIENMRLSIEKKNFAALNDLLSKSSGEARFREILKMLPRMFGGEEVLTRALSLAKGTEAEAPLLELYELFLELKGLDLMKYVSVDLGLVHRISYYTGILLRGYLEGSGHSFLKGGRYDGLTERFGKDMPSVGFAIDVDSIITTQMRNEQSLKPKRPVTIVHYEEGMLKSACAYCDEKALEGTACEISVFESEKESRAFAINRNDCDLYCVISKSGTHEEILQREER